MKSLHEIGVAPVLQQSTQPAPQTVGDLMPPGGDGFVVRGPKSKRDVTRGRR
ncbi:MAG: hypothetical protein AAGJ95_09545 [Cyanobacteria bacterium J06554_11]